MAENSLPKSVYVSAYTEFSLAVSSMSVLIIGLVPPDAAKLMVR